MIPSKHSGYLAGRRVYPLDFGGGDAPQQTSSTTTVNNVNIPDYARPYVEDMLGRSNALTTQNPYQSYQGQRVAGFTPLQQSSYVMAAGMQPSAHLGTGANMAQGVYNRAQSTGQYSPNTNFSAGNAPSQVQSPWGMHFTGTQQWGSDAAQQYMNPYMQAVVDIQKREATRNSNMMGEQQAAQATMAGAFGGSRHAIVDSNRNRDLMQLHNDIQAQGSNRAWDQAQQMFASDQGRDLQSQMANQSAGLGLTGQIMQGQMANQRAGLDWNSQRLTAQQLGEQSRQFGANLGLGALNAQLGAAGLMQGFGQSDFNQRLGIAGLQNQFGTQMQGTQQAGFDAQYQDFQNRQNWPYRNLEFMNSMIRGLPIAQGTSQMYSSQPGPSPISQLAGLGTAAYGMSRMAEGGQVEDEQYRNFLQEQEAKGIRVPGNQLGPNADVQYSDPKRENPFARHIPVEYEHSDGSRSTAPKAGRNVYLGAPLAGRQRPAGAGRGNVNPPNAKEDAAGLAGLLISLIK